MARGPWADYWAREQEEAGESFSGQDIYELAPQTPAWADKWAKQLASDIQSINGETLDALYRLAVQSGFAKDREAFGLYLGMQAAGHGITWNDDLSTNLTIKVPHSEFYRRW
jgi:hypothetical protein